MASDTPIFDEKYVSGVTTQAEKSEKSKVKQFLSEQILKSDDAIMYGTSKPIRIVIRGRTAHKK